MTFGDCCSDLKDALTLPQKRFFRIEENGVLYLTVGAVETKEGTGWFDQAVLYCPFCGTHLQAKQKISGRSN